MTDVNDNTNVFFGQNQSIIFVYFTKDSAPRYEAYDEEHLPT